MFLYSSGLFHSNWSAEALELNAGVFGCELLRPFLSMIMRGVGRLWATRLDPCMRRQDALHRGISDTNFWYLRGQRPLKSEPASGSGARHTCCDL
jgi:hypothetical protein